MALYLIQQHDTICNIFLTSGIPHAVWDGNVEIMLCLPEIALPSTTCPHEGENGNSKHMVRLNMPLISRDDIADTTAHTHLIRHSRRIKCALIRSVSIVIGRQMSGAALRQMSGVSLAEGGVSVTELESDVALGCIDSRVRFSLRI